MENERIRNHIASIYRDLWFSFINEIISFQEHHLPGRHPDSEPTSGDEKAKEEKEEGEIGSPQAQSWRQRTKTEEKEAVIFLKILNFLLPSGW